MPRSPPTAAHPHIARARLFQTCKRGPKRRGKRRGNGAQSLFAILPRAVRLLAHHAHVLFLVRLCTVSQCTRHRDSARARKSIDGFLLVRPLSILLRSPSLVHALIGQYSAFIRHKHTICSYACMKYRIVFRIFASSHSCSSSFN